MLYKFAKLYKRTFGSGLNQVSKPEVAIYINTGDELVKFDPIMYARLNPDVDRSFIDPTQHYISYGFKENRHLRPKEKIINEAVQKSLSQLETIKIGLLLDSFDDGSLSPCSTIRIVLPLSYLRALNEIEYSFINVEQAAQCDVVYTNRLALSPEDYLHLFNGGKKFKLIYDLDDDLINGEMARSIEASLLASDQITVSTKFLKGVIQDLAQVHATVIHNFPLSSNFVTKKIDNTIRLFYFGTCTHDGDWASISDAVSEVVKGAPNLEVFVMGAVSNPRNLPDYVKYIDVTGLHHYDSFVAKFTSLGRFNIGLVPLCRNSINYSKSAIKFYDYLLNCDLVVASNIGEYKGLKHPNLKVIEDDSKESWVKELFLSIEQAKKIQCESQTNFNVPFGKLNSINEHTTLLSKTFLADSNKSPTKITHLESSLARKILSYKHFSGTGIEIGALHNPLSVPRSASVRYLDRLSKDDLYVHYPELKKLKLVDVDIIDNGEKLITIVDNSLDFIIANHMIEHCENPIGTLQNFEKKLKVGGVLYLAVPNCNFTFDKGRNKTSFEHLIEDYNDDGRSSRRTHFEEWVTICEKNIGYKHNLQDIESRVDTLDKMNYSIHYHVWDGESFVEQINKMRNVGYTSLCIVDGAICKDETILIMKKF